MTFPGAGYSVGAGFSPREEETMAMAFWRAVVCAVVLSVGVAVTAPGASGAVMNMPIATMQKRLVMVTAQRDGLKARCDAMSAVLRESGGMIEKFSDGTTACLWCGSHWGATEYEWHEARCLFTDAGWSEPVKGPMDKH